jgi:hypothetical protein
MILCGLKIVLIYLEYFHIGKTEKRSDIFISDQQKTRWSNIATDDLSYDIIQVLLEQTYHQRKN